jgi:hypothetical protein
MRVNKLRKKKIINKERRLNMKVELKETRIRLKRLKKKL